MKRQRGTDQESIRSENVKNESLPGVDFTVKVCTYINRYLLVAVFGNRLSKKPCHCVQKYFSASYFLVPMFNGSVTCIHNIEGIR